MPPIPGLDTLSRTEYDGDEERLRGYQADDWAQRASASDPAGEVYARSVQEATARQAFEAAAAQNANPYASQAAILAEQRRREEEGQFEALAAQPVNPYQQRADALTSTFRTSEDYEDEQNSRIGVQAPGQIPLAALRDVPPWERTGDPAIDNLDPRDRERLEATRRLDEYGGTGFAAAPTDNLSWWQRGIAGIGEGIGQGLTRVGEARDYVMSHPETLLSLAEDLGDAVGPYGGRGDKVPRTFAPPEGQDRLSESLTTTGHLAQLVPNVPYQVDNLIFSGIRGGLVGVGIVPDEGLWADISAMALQAGVPGIVGAVGRRYGPQAARAVAAELRETGAEAALDLAMGRGVMPTDPLHGGGPRIPPDVPPPSTAQAVGKAVDPDQLARVRQSWEGISDEALAAEITRHRRSLEAQIAGGHPVDLAPLDLQEALLAERRGGKPLPDMADRAALPPPGEPLPPAALPPPASAPASTAAADALPEVDATLVGIRPQMERTAARAAGTADQAAQLRPGEDMLGFKGVPDEVRALIQRHADAANGFAGQRRGVITDPEAERMAAEKALGTTIPQWLRTKPGKAFNQEEALALGNTLVKVGKDYDQLLADVTAARAAGIVTANMEAQLANTALEFASLAAIRRGAAAEAGRALRSFQTTLDGAVASGLGREKAIEKAFEAIGTDKAKFAQWVEEFSKLDPSDSIARYQMLQALHTPSLMDALTTWRYASMLSSWKTHLANTTSNATEALARPLRTAVAGYGGEAVADLHGMVSGVQDGIAAFGRALATGVTRDMASKADAAAHVRPGAFMHGLLPQLGESGAVGRANVIAGRAVRAPLDLLSAADEFWKAVNTSGALHAEAYRKAAGNRAKMDEILANIDQHPELVQRAHEAALKATFQEDPGAFANWLVQGRSLKGVPGMAVSYIVPFVRTPANIFYRGAKLTARPVTGVVEAGVKAARGDVRGAREAAAEAVIAGTLAAGFATLAVQGNLSGSGPQDPKKRRLLEETGWQPHSVRVGDRWISYSNWGPVGVQMGLIADGWEGYREGQQPGHAWHMDVVRRVARSLEDQSYTRGIGEFFSAVVAKDPGTAIEAFGANLIGQHIPFGSALAAGERTADPADRAKDSWQDRVLGRIPGASNAVPEEPGPFGATRAPTDDSLLARIALPWKSSSVRTDPAAAEVARLIQAGQPVSVRQYGPNDEFAGEKQSPEQRRTLQTEMGRTAHAVVLELLGRDDYASATDEEKARRLTRALSLAYEVADRKLGERVNRSPEERAELARQSIPRYEGVQGSPEEIRLQNYEIAVANARLRQLVEEAGNRQMAEYRLYQEDKNQYGLTRRRPVNPNYLRVEDERINKLYGVKKDISSRAGSGALVAAGTGR